MDKDSFFKLFLDFNSRFHGIYNNVNLTVSPYTIGLEHHCFTEDQLNELFLFFSLRCVDYKYSIYYVQVGVRLIFTFNVD